MVLSLDPGGAERMVCDLVRSALRQPVTVLVVCLDRRGRLAPEAEAAGARVVVMDRKPGLDLRLFLRLRRLFVSTGVDVIHTHSLAAMFYAGPAARLAGVRRRVHTQHNNRIDDYGFRDRARFRATARCFHHLVAVSSATRPAFRRLGVPEDRSTTVFNGIDVERFRPSPLGADARAPAPDATITLGTVARLVPEKGLDVLITAVKHLRDAGRNVRLVIAGDGPLRGPLEAQTSDLGLQEAVRFLGFQADVTGLLSRLDVFVQSSLTEGVPLAVLEAMACGLPVVATRVGGLPEVLHNETCGITVPPNDFRGLAAALDRLVEDPTLRRQLGDRGAIRAREHFSLEGMAAAYEVLYRG